MHLVRQLADVWLLRTEVNVLRILLLPRQVKVVARGRLFSRPAIMAPGLRPQEFLGHAPLGHLLLHRPALYGVVRTAMPTTITRMPPRMTVLVILVEGIPVEILVGNKRDTSK